MPSILDLLQLEPSEESRDYVERKQQFHLHGLLTEQRHPRTWDLSFTIAYEAEAGLRMILSVDEDIRDKIETLAGQVEVLDQAAGAVADALREGRRVYVYGCGATGRLAKQMESALWRPFWRGLQAKGLGSRLQGKLPSGLQDALVGEMTGGDRALVSSLEGFEDLMLVGELQLRDHKIRRGDVVFCVTEGGETSSVIGTILAAAEPYAEDAPSGWVEARPRLYFIYNNPDDVLRPFERSRRVLDHPGITRINLATGPQAIAGSTRMQATTIETFVVGVILEEALSRLLRPHLSTAELAALGFENDLGVAARLRTLAGVLEAVNQAAPALARLTELEASTYERQGFATYFAQRALITVFIDGAERSPTFRLFPLDQVGELERRCWVQVWTEGQDLHQAWQNFLGRRFRGLDPLFYRDPLEEGVADPYLRRAALKSLAGAGQDQELAYDFSFSEANVARRGPRAGDLGVIVLMDEEAEELRRKASSVARFRQLHRRCGARLAVIHLHSAGRGQGNGEGEGQKEELWVPVRLDVGEDPLALRGQLALKILLNAHSTGTMARLGRVIGNTMTNVSPSNLKLIGRATFLVLSHVNDVLRQPAWTMAHGATEPLSFAEANAVLLDAMEHVRTGGPGQTAEVALSIIRILESLRCRRGLGWEESGEILQAQGLGAYLQRLNPALRAGRPPA